MKNNYFILFYLNVLVTNKIVNFFVKSSRKRPPRSQYLINGRLWQPILEMFKPSLVATTFMNSRRGGLRELWLKLIPFQISWHSKNFIFFHLSISGSTNFPTFTSYSGNQTLYPLLWQPKVGASLFRWLVLQAVFPVILSKNSSLRVRISPNRALWSLLLNYTLFSFRSEIARISFLLSGSKMKIVNCQQIAGNGANIETD